MPELCPRCLRPLDSWQHRATCLDATSDGITAGLFTRLDARMAAQNGRQSVPPEPPVPPASEPPVPPASEPPVPPAEADPKAAERERQRLKKARQRARQRARPTPAELREGRASSPPASPLVLPAGASVEASEGVELDAGPGPAGEGVEL